MVVTNEFERDLSNQAQLKRPGRVDMIVFQNVPDAGDGSPGIQRCFRNYLHEGGMEKDLDLVGYAIKGTSVNISNAEMQQLSAIGGATISGTQWGYVGALNQGLTQTSNVNFGQITMSGDIVMGSDNITFTSGLVDTVDVSAHDHSGGDKGVAIPFTSLSGDIVYGQLDSIVDTSGVGTASMISVATHVHTDADGSSKIAHANTTGIGEDNHHAKTHNNNEHSTNYKADFSENSGFNRAFGTTTNTVIHGNDGRLSNSRTPTSHTHDNVRHGVASNDVIFNNATLRGTTSASYVKLKEIIVYRTLDLRLDWTVVTNGGTGYTRVYINGVATGAEHTSGTGPESETEDVSVEFGDLLQIYAHHNGTNQVSVSAMTIKFKEYTSNDP